MNAILLVFVGGGLGSILRYGLSQWLPMVNFPWATLVANALSSLVMGCLLLLSSKGNLGTDVRLLLATGFCGGFSTFSTFSAETIQLLQQQQFSLAVCNIVINVLLCLVCVLVGMWLLR